MEQTLKKLAGGEHVTLVALGDSTTEVTFYTQGRMNWLQLLTEALVETYGVGTATVINSGVGGDTAGMALGRLSRDVLRFAPDLVIVSLGMNDAVGKLQHLPEFRREMRELLERIRDGSGAEMLLRTPNPVVTVRGMPMPPEQPVAGRVWDSPERPVGEYARAVVDIAREWGIPVVDHYSLWREKVYEETDRPHPPGLWPRMGDAVHPGFLGHLAFFRELAPLFRVPRFFPWEEAEAGPGGAHEKEETP